MSADVIKNCSYPDVCKHGAMPKCDYCSTSRFFTSQGWKVSRRYVRVNRFAFTDKKFHKQNTRYMHILLNLKMLWL